ncbi:flavin reductase family protein [Kitasatospora sp. NPDC096140]|uniref:flavin reductase family protein n=1 Tax=unclassified Kitasatospora TaxID=2633591 RepID=UPI00331A8616
MASPPASSQAPAGRRFVDRAGPQPRSARQPSTAGHVPADDYRGLMSRFPTGVAVVTTTDPVGRPRGLTCSSLSSVTTAPPVLSVCLKAPSSTLDALVARQAFAVNLLHTGGQAAARVFTTAVAERFAHVDWRPSPVLGLPWLSGDALALAGCRVRQLIEVGDHVLVLGEVVEVHRAGGVPLLYGLRRFADWPAAEQDAEVPAAVGARGVAAP